MTIYKEFLGTRCARVLVNRKWINMQKIYGGSFIMISMDAFKHGDIHFFCISCILEVLSGVSEMENWRK